MSHYPPEADEAQRRHYNDGPYDLVFPMPPPYNPQLSGLNPSHASSSTLISPRISFPTPVVDYPPLPRSPTSFMVDYPPLPRSPTSFMVDYPPLPQSPTRSFPTPMVDYPPLPRSPTSFMVDYPPLPQSPTSSFPTPMVVYPRSPTAAYSPLRRHSTLPNIHEEQRQGDISVVSRFSRKKMPRVPRHSGSSSTDNRPEANLLGGHIPQRVPRRRMTFKKVGLLHGHLILDNPVPKRLLELCGNDSTEREFTHMRYSAATCDPNDFKDDGYTLRQVLYDPPRHTELFIVMTMYNEDENLFTRSMHGLMKNIAHLCTRERSRTWSKEGWKKVVVCIVSDGRAKVSPRTLSVIAAMGCYQEGIAKTKIGDKAVTAHIYEYTTQVSISPSLKIEGVAERGIVPVQIIFCLKEKNQKKINSHRWFFNAFGPILQPKVCVLLDVGTMPGPTSIYHLWKAFDINPKLGGACGEIVALKGKYGKNLLNPLVAAQNFEYKMSNILDKALESVFGYITVLPGAFSAYRYIAVQNDVSGEAGPLHKYFLGEQMHSAGGIFTANMYLAEDRILCWELFSKRGCAWTLHYVKSAYAVTDVPDSLPELMSQRRRWLNGSFFAGVHSTFHFYYIYRSSHSKLRKFWIHVEMFYMLLNLMFSWLALANYYIAFYILATSLEDRAFGFSGINIVNDLLNYFYLGLLITCFILALGNRPQGSKLGYTLAIVGFAFITIYMTLAAGLLAYKGIEKMIAKHKGNWELGDFLGNIIFRNIVLSIAGTTGLYIFASLIFFEPWHIVTSLVQYLLMAPSHVNVFNVYAFANVHDVSWGTKGENAASLGTVTTGESGEVVAAIPDEKDLNELYEDALYLLTTKRPKLNKTVDNSQQQEDYYRNFRTNVLLAWVLSNSLFAALIAGTNPKPSIHGADAAVAGYMTFLLYSVALFALIKASGSALYMIIWLFNGE